MCGLQIGSEQLKSILAHNVQTEQLNQAACGLQVGMEELSAIMAHSAATATAEGLVAEEGVVASAACGIQIG